MASVEWSDQALDDLDAVCLFIARDSPAAAEILARHVFEAAETLERFPEAGRVVPEVGRQTIRELIVGNYRLIYRVEADSVDILTVHHGARRLGEIP